MAKIVFVSAAVLVLGQAIFFAAANANWISHGHDVNEFCKGKHVDLSTIEDLKVLAQNLNETEHKCSPHVASALRAMEAIVEDRNACTMEKAQAITKFANDYLRNLGADGEGESGATADRLPQSLVKFAIAYGMKVSSICKEHMLNDFLYAANAILRKRFDGKFHVFESFLLKESPLSYVVSPIIKTGEIVLPGDLLQVLPGIETKLDEYFSDPLALDLVRELCEGTLQPLYEPMLLPLAQLVRAGFNSRQFSYPSKMRKHGRFWSLAVFMCETVKTIKTPDYGSSSDSDELAAQTGPVRKLNARQVVVGLDMKLERLPPYEPHVKVGAKIIGRFDTDLRLVIKSYDANKNEAERLQDRIFKRSLLVFAMMSRKGQHRNLFKKLLQRFKGGDKELEETKNGLLTLMDASEGDSIPFLLAKWSKKLARKTALLTLIVFVLTLFMFSLSLKQGPAKAIHHGLRDSLGKLFSNLVG